MMQPLVSLVAGVVFGLGLAVAEMTNPLKVLDFLDLAGNWDPSLAFVMGGAVLVTLVAFRFVLRRPVPLYGDRFHLPTLTQLDRKLLGGAALFGIGWGLCGVCPGPAIAGLGTGNWDLLWALGGIVLGALAQGLRAGRG